LSAYTVGAAELFKVTQVIEGFNCADLAWGTANAKAVTLSFWVRSSLTGTFGGAFVNGAFNRNYPFTYTISSANTWEYKTITVPGDTTGTWNVSNVAGIQVIWSLGTGSSLSGTAGAWAAGNIQSATGATSVVGTNGATWYVTGCQLEVGTVATSFDFRSYGTELALCQRYYERGTVGVAFSYTPSAFGNGKWIEVPVNFNVNKRATPTIAYGTVSQNTNFSPSVLNTNIMINADIIGTQSFSVAPGGSATPPSSGTYWYGTIPWTASIEL
jgi:hypothetical protein